MHCETRLRLDFLSIWVRGSDHCHLMAVLDEAFAQVHALPLEAPETMREGRTCQDKDVHLTI